LSERVGQLIENGQYDEITRLFNSNPRVAAELEGAASYLPGSTIPNYTLKAPDKLTIFSNSKTVQDATPLSDLLQPNMGCLDWAACTLFRR
jgi:hypothetical protein